VTAQDSRRENMAGLRGAQRLRWWASRNMRAADRLRMEYVDAAYTPIGQRALVMFGVAFLVLVVNLAVLGALLFL
jgi:hypothetical protein